MLKPEKVFSMAVWRKFLMGRSLELRSWFSIQKPRNFLTQKRLVLLTESLSWKDSSEGEDIAGI